MRVLCLANSKKLGGRCIAGLDIDTGAWIRPVHRREGGEFYFAELHYEDGTPLEVLDVFEFEPGGNVSTLYHPEDVLARSEWTFERVATGEDLRLVDSLVERGPDLLGSRGDSVATPEHAGAALDASLTVIRPVGVRFIKDQRFQRTRHRVHFRLDGQFYDLSLTDPVILNRMRQLDDAEYLPADLDIKDNPYLTISLGEPFDVTGRCYKLVAAVFPR
jgi:hypothetical protein